MATGMDRQRLVDEFLDLAARLEGLRLLDSGSVVDPVRLQRWQTAYAALVTKILANRQVLIATPTIVSFADLEKWISEARNALTVV